MTQELREPGTTWFPGRTGAAAGLAFFVLYFVATGLLAGPINQADSLQRAAKTFNDQAGGFDAAAALLMVSIPLLLWFALAIRGALARAERGHGTLSPLVLPAATAAAACLLVGGALMGGTAFLAESRPVDGVTAAFAHSAAEACLFYALVFFGVVALTAAAGTRRHAAFPQWFGIVAAVLGLAIIVGAAGSPLVRPLALLAGVSTDLFFLTTCFVLWRGATGKKAVEP